MIGGARITPPPFVPSFKSLSSHNSAVIKYSETATQTVGMCNVLTNMDGVFSHTYNQVAQQPGEANHAAKVSGSGSRLNSQTSLSAHGGIADVPASVTVGNGSSAVAGMGNCNRAHIPVGTTANHQQPPSYHSAVAGGGGGSNNCSPTASSALRNNASSNGVHQAQQHLLADNKQSSTSSDAVVAMNRNPNPSSSPTANTGGVMKNSTCDVFL